MTPDPATAPDFAAAFADAVRASGLTLERIRTRLEHAGTTVSTATLSYWQTGRSTPSRARSMQVVEQLETILQVPGGMLSRLVGPPATRRARSLGSIDSAVPGVDRATRIMSEMGLTWGTSIDRVTVHDTLYVRPDRSEDMQLTRQILRATVDGARRFVVALREDDDATSSLEPVSGCALGDVVVVPTERLVIAEMLLPWPLRKGDLVMTEHLVVMSGEQTSFRVERAVLTPMRELVVEVRFQGGLPAQVRSVVCEDVDAGYAESDGCDDRVVPVIGGLAQGVHLDVGPGIYGLRWSWD